MLMFGLRLGTDPRVVVTTTPKPIKSSANCSPTLQRS
jgi:phage terminase large subunit-like protein